MTYDKNLGELRNRLTEIDTEIIQLMAERQRTVAEIGRVKQTHGAALRDFRRERDVIENALRVGADEGLDPEMVESVIRTLITFSLVKQEKRRVSSSELGFGRRALLIGGAGKMGRWFCEHLLSQQFDVVVADPSLDPDAEGFRRWQDAGLDYDVIVVATPLAVTASILSELASLKPRGLVFDIGSLKTPLRDGLRALADAGCQVASLHPMFGPSTQLLSGRHLIFVDAGCPQATAAARDLFANTMVSQLDMSLEEHDHMIAFVLGLSHAVNIAFFDALGRSGESIGQLMRLSSTTFDAQVAVSSAVAREDPGLYFDIQRLNAEGMTALDALCESAEKLRSAVRDDDRDRFAQIMLAGQAYFALRRRSQDESAAEDRARNRRRHDQVNGRG